MPFLQFVCKDCGKRFEELVKLGAETAVCPQCGEKCERLYQGKCSFGSLGGKGSSGGCSGNCAGCAGCGGH